MFINRTDAGKQLADALEHLKGEHVVVLALPRGGVPVAFEVAQALSAPLDLVMVRKIGAPGQKELAVAAVANGKHPETVTNDDVMRILGLGEDYIEREAQTQLEEIARRRKRYFGHTKRVPLKGRTVVVVDDGVATGATMRAALRSVSRAGAGRIVVAVPVASPEAVTTLSKEAHEVVCLDKPSGFGAIGFYYQDFPQVSDDEVIRILDEARKIRDEHSEETQE